jgi:hypothetical protein
VFFIWLSIAAALTFLGFTSAYIVPSADGEMLALLAALIASVMFGLFAAKDRSFRADNAYFQALSARFAFVADPKLRIPGFATIGFVLTFFAIEKTAIAFWTYGVGVPGQETVTVASYYQSRRWFCNGLYLREAPFTLSPAICTEQYSYSGIQAPRPGAKLHVYGKVTSFGVTPDGFEVAAP